MSRVRVTIDRLALRGFESAERKALTEGLETGLSRFLADAGARAAWARTHRTPVIKLGAMPFEGGPAGGRNFGARVARAIGKELKP